MKILYNSLILLSLVLMVTSLSSVAKNDSFEDRIARNKAEMQHILREQEEHNERIRIRLENKELFRTTGKCVGCDLVDMNLISEIQELNKNEMPIDLSGANLTDALACGVSLKKANLSKANLTRTSFHRSNLMHANLTDAQLKYTDFSKADISYAKLDQLSMFMGIKSSTLDLHGTNVEGVRISGEPNCSLFFLSHYMQNLNPQN